MTPEQIPAAWKAALDRADELDPVIREALRPVYDRLKADAPHEASAFALALICRALRIIRLPDGNEDKANLIRRDMAMMCAVHVALFPDHP